MTTRTVTVFENPNDWHRRYKGATGYSVHQSPVLKRLEYLKSKGIETNHLMYLTPEARMQTADKLINDNFLPSDINCKAFRATITALQPIRNKTMQAMFDDNFVKSAGEQVLLGPYNQRLKVNIQLHQIPFTPDMVRWQKEDPFMFTTVEYKNKAVVHNSCTHAGNSCFAIAQGCKIENDVLMVGKNATFFFNGKKEVDFEYHFQYNQNSGKNIAIPVDMDIQRFNFLHYNWEKELENKDYIVKDAVSVAKTNNGNYVVSQDNPRRAWVVLPGGEVIIKHTAQWGNAKTVLTSQTSLLDYTKAIKEYEKAMDAEREIENKRYQERMNEMYETNEGWYVVELPCFQNDYRKGGHKRRFTNWKILATSQIDAYHKAVKAATEIDLFSFAEPEKCQINFYGVWTDDKEMMLREEGLI